MGIGDFGDWCVLLYNPFGPNVVLFSHYGHLDALLMLLPALLNQIEMTTNSAKFEFLYFLAQPIVNKQFQL